MIYLITLASHRRSILAKHDNKLCDFGHYSASPNGDTHNCGGNCSIHTRNLPVQTFPANKPVLYVPGSNAVTVTAMVWPLKNPINARTASGPIN